MKKNIGRLKTLSVIIIIALAVGVVCPKGAWARSGAGGGEVETFDVGEWAQGQAVGLASSALGGAIASEIFPGTMGYFDSITGNPSAPDFGTAIGDGATRWADNYSLNFAGGEVNRAVYMYGQYKGWDPDETAWRSAVISSVASESLTSLDWAGLASGVAKGAVKGSLTYAAVDEKGEMDPWVGAGINVAGEFASNIPRQGFSEGLLTNTAFSIPGEIISIGVDKYADDRELDANERYMLYQAFSGVNILTGAAASWGTAELLGIEGKRRQVDLKRSTQPYIRGTGFSSRP